MDYSVLRILVTLQQNKVDGKTFLFFRLNRGMIVFVPCT